MSIRRSLLVSLLLAPQFAIAADLSNQDLYFDVHSVTLSVSDQVSDGCLPAPKSLAAAMAAALRRNAFVIVDPENASATVPEVEVTALGYAVNDDCMVVFSVDLVREINADVPYSEELDESARRAPFLLRLAVYKSLLTGGRQGMQRQIELEADQGGDDLRVAVEEARSAVKRNWPELWEAYSTARGD
jgi:hypothetical protein